ncbi:MAG: hypothetical protein LUF35_13765 [Lachnospiraceae bacterium]|nr:hypothetical protein [Lachnospiraceae bacterium]
MGYFSRRRADEKYAEMEQTVVSEADGRDEPDALMSRSNVLNKRENSRVKPDAPDVRKSLHVKPDAPDIRESFREKPDASDVRESLRAKADARCRCGISAIRPIDFSVPSDEMQIEKDFRMLQGMYPAAAKELLSLIEEECDQMEYEGSAMFDEYPDDTTIYMIQKRIEKAAQKEQKEDEDLIRVMLLQEMHRRRTRHRSCMGEML